MNNNLDKIANHLEFLGYIVNALNKVTSRDYFIRFPSSRSLENSHG